LQSNTTIIHRNFLGSLNSEVSRYDYKKCIRYFFKFVNIEIDDYNALFEWASSKDKKQLESKIIDYILYLKGNKKLAPHTITSYLNPIKHFFRMNDILNVNWDKINKFKGKAYNKIQDRPYTREEIQKLLELGTLRDKVMILLMVSGGLRVGSLLNLVLRDITPIDKYSLYQIKTYAGTESEYITFCTPECRKYIDQYLEFRKRYGERLNPISPLLRHHFDTKDIFAAAIAKPLATETFRSIMVSLLHKSGVRLRQEQLEGEVERQRRGKRTEIMVDHACRKFFDTTLETEGINPVYIEFLLGHDQKLKTRYAKPTPSQLLEGNGDKVLGYIHGIDALTINEENRLKIKVKKLADSQDEIMLMRLKHEQEMKSVREEMHKQFDQIMVMIQQNPKLAKIKPEVLVKKKI
jgi:integrase